ncbi:PAS domain S-box/diguanylate cyclase (GGDEF) domain-containing protein [Thioflavicoccus mobilis 8321]|uniref:PAS domain S-box/diguanylate cyclase (GGDEF) domain-containing protein n=1 Tax=Thioflavicoccus mobilis 8321 TaxID=765912 RepID=L0GW45_9GAMM|nr:EAL domain-containing protein [Thioflavicoccus mobilis]AGA89600.1 PAS domain S-box/diguanylate cyclase (GGDEF) domain-containing protein [Thioflavicoccus mobilis 8321]
MSRMPLTRQPLHEAPSPGDGERWTCRYRIMVFATWLLPSLAQAGQGWWPIADSAALGGLLAGGICVFAAWGLRASNTIVKPRRPRGDSTDAYLSALITSLDELALVLDRERIIRLFAQPATFHRLTHADEVVGQRLDRAGLPEAIVTRLMAEATAIFDRNDAHLRTFRLDLGPEQRTLETRILPVDSSHGRVSSILILTRDITPRLLAEQNQAQRAALGRALTAVSIDLLRTPSNDLDSTIRTALERLGILLGADRGYQVLIEDDRMYPTHMWSVAGAAAPYEADQSLPIAALPNLTRTLAEERPVRIRSVAALPKGWATERATLAAKGAQSLIAVPLIDRGRLVGFVGFDSIRTTRGWSDDAQRGLRIFAELLVGLLERRRTDAARLADQARYREAIDDIQEIVFQTDADCRWTFLNPAWERVTGFPVTEALGRCSLEFAHPDDRRLGLVPFKPLVRGESDHCRYELRCLTRDGAERWLEVYARLRCGPQGEVAGTYGTLMDVTERKAAEEEIRQLAFYDSLTGLPNRRLLVDRLYQAMAAGSRDRQHGALLFIDLDNFKILNDTSGHHKGDLLLQQVAGRLRGCIRECDTVARLGGDEFVVMLAQLNPLAQQAAAQVATIGEKIRVALGAPYDLGNGPYDSTPSIGATLFFGHQWSVDDLLKRADIAMYQAKTAGRNALCFFDPTLQKEHNSRLRQAKDINGAIGRGELHLLFQPQIDAEDRVVSAEALLRWRQPERGTVSAAELIPQAIEAGLIATVGRWVMEEACNRLAAWSREPDLAELTLAVNVSLQQVQQTDFVPEVLSILKASGADPTRLRLELPERLFTDDIDTIAVKLQVLRWHGVGLALDDFGTGQGSLRRLQQLPLDQIKIDACFVRGLADDTNDATVARAIIAMGQALGLTVVAEGVERADQRQRLLDLGCQRFQGYLFSRPVPQGALRSRLKTLNRPKREAPQVAD